MRRIANPKDVRALLTAHSMNTLQDARLRKSWQSGLSQKEVFSRFDSEVGYQKYSLLRSTRVVAGNALLMRRESRRWFESNLRSREYLIFKNL